MKKLKVAKRRRRKIKKGINENNSNFDFWIYKQ